MKPLRAVRSAHFASLVHGAEMPVSERSRSQRTTGTWRSARAGGRAARRRDRAPARSSRSDRWSAASSGMMRTGIQPADGDQAGTEAGGRGQHGKSGAHHGVEDGKDHRQRRVQSSPRPGSARRSHHRLPARLIEPDNLPAAIEPADALGRAGPGAAVAATVKSSPRPPPRRRASQSRGPRCT
jgi:hypothetical protein